MYLKFCSYNICHCFSLFLPHHHHCWNLKPDISQLVPNFQKSDVPGEAFVHNAMSYPATKMTAMEAFREANLMMPKPMREFIWLDMLYNPSDGRSSDSDKRDRKKKDARVRQCYSFLFSVCTVINY